VIIYLYIMVFFDQWSVEQVQLWAEEALNMEAADREKLIAYAMADLFSMEAQGRLNTDLQALSPVIRTFLRNQIRSLREALAGQAAAPLRKPPPNAAVGSAAKADMLPGELRGKFAPEAIIGRGGAGTVVSARGALEGRGYRVAIKLVYDVAESRVRELAREAVILQRLDSPHVVKLKDAGYAPRDYAYWFVMDFVAGASLQQLLDAQHPFDEAAVAELAGQALAGLAAIHAEPLRAGGLWGGAGLPGRGLALHPARRFPQRHPGLHQPRGLPSAGARPPR